MYENIPTYVLIDGENIDATLGMSVLGHRPESEERPRWDRLLEFTKDLTDDGLVQGLFFINASTGHLPMTFVQALLAMSYRPIPLAGSSEEKVVDIGIQRMLAAIQASGRGNVVLVSHDGDFVPQLSDLLQAGHRVGIMCFREYLAAQIQELEGITLYDLEYDVNAFTSVLPRVRIVELDEFNPQDYLL